MNKKKISIGLNILIVFVEILGLVLCFNELKFVTLQKN